MDHGGSIGVSGFVGNKGKAKKKPPQTQLDSLRGLVDCFKDSARKENTAKAYDPKLQEFKDFCDHVYKDVDVEKRYIVNHDRLYKFLFYHIFRNK